MADNGSHILKESLERPQDDAFKDFFKFNFYFILEYS